MSLNQNNITDKTSISSNDVVAFLVEQYGDQIKKLVEQTESSYAKLKFKGEKDELAEMIEAMHYNPLKSSLNATVFAESHLSLLVHNKLMIELFQKRKNEISFLYGVKTYTHKKNVYIVSLKDNSFESRDSFRNDLLRLHDSQIYSRHIQVLLDFMPEDSSESDLLSEEVVKIELK